MVQTEQLKAIRPQVTDDPPNKSGTSKQRYGFAFLLQDLKQRKLIPVKLVSFISYAGYGVLLPFLAVHMKSLGITVEETGIIMGTSSVVGVLTPFIVGLIADKLGNFKVLLSILYGFTSIGALLFLVVPAVEPPIDLSINRSLSSLCCHNNEETDNSSVVVNILPKCQPYPCELDIEHSNEALYNVTAATEHLVYICHSGNGSDVGSNFTQPMLYPTNLSANAYNWSLQLLCSSELIRDDEHEPSTTNGIHHTFWIYFVLRVGFEIFLGSSFALSEGASLALVKEIGGDLGFQRMFGFIGISIFSPASGALTDYFTVNSNVPNFKPTFYLFSSLIGTAAILALTIDLGFKPPAEQLMKQMTFLFKNVKLVTLLIIVLIYGILLACSGNFLALYLEELGGSTSLMGLAITVSCICSIPLLLFSNIIFRKFSSPNNFLVFSFAVYTIRLFGYSYMTEPRMCLLYESLEGITGVLTVTAVMSYAAQLGNQSTVVASLQGIIMGIYFGLGGGIGNSAGSFVIGVYGYRLTFRILAVIACVTGFVYMLFNVFYLRRRNVVNVETAGAASVNVVEEV